jgi:uncharacterized membrane protein
MAIKTRAELKLQAKQSLGDNWFNAIIIFLLFILLLSVATASFIGSIIFSGVLLFGLNAYFLDLIRKQETSFSHLFSGFNYFVQTLLIYLLSALYIILWSLLLIIPGIMKAFSYSMTYYILKDNPNMEAGQVIDASSSLMEGHRWRLFVLSLSFFWWFMLVCVTAGIALVYVGPYMSATFAGFYQDLKENKV